MNDSRHQQVAKVIKLFKEPLEVESIAQDTIESVCDWDLESTGGVLSMRE